MITPQAIVDNDLRRGSSILIDHAVQIAGVYHKNVPTHPKLDLGIVPGTETQVF